MLLLNEKQTIRAFVSLTGTHIKNVHKFLLTLEYEYVHHPVLILSCLPIIATPYSSSTDPDLFKDFKCSKTSPRVLAYWYLGWV